MTRLPPIKEDELQANIVDFLRLHRLTVLQTNLAKRRPVCDKGVPDLIVTADSWPEGCWLGMEIKTEKGEPTKEQAELLARHRIVIVRSMDEAMDAVKAYVRRITVWTDGFSTPRRTLSNSAYTDLVRQVDRFSRENIGGAYNQRLTQWLRFELKKIGIDTEEAL